MESLKNLDAVFKPKSVALIGASTAPGKLGYDILFNLIHGGFEGPLYPINPKADEILGLKAYKDIGSTPAPADLAVVVIPARLVPGTIEACGKAGVKAAVVVTGGFAEAGPDGETLQAALAEAAKRYGIRVIGPNCQGVNRPHHNLCASWPLLTSRGGMAFIAQSGTVGAALMDWASEDQLGVSVFVSLGNRADVDESDCIRYFNEDPDTNVIALYVEGVKRPAAFLESLAGAKKPVVILKAGRTARGKVAAESHTKSMAGSDEIYNAIFRKYGVHRADNLEELYDFAKILSYMKKPAGKRLLHISSSGGAAILAIDEAEKWGIASPPPSQALKDRLREFLPPHCGVSNPIDLTGDAITDPSLYARVIETSRGEYDTMAVIFGDPIHGASRMVTNSELVIFCGGADVEREERILMHRKGIPVFPNPERAVRAFSRFFAFEEGKARTAESARPHTAVPLRLMPAGDAADLMRKYGLPALEAPLAASAEEAVALFRKMGGPAVMKIASPDVPHKSDAGGIRLHLATEGEVRKAYGKILSSVHKKLPGAKIEGVTLSPMAKPGTEVILGVITDVQYGPCLMFGLGGIFTEVYRDVQFSLLPADEREFLRMIEGIRGYPLLAGIRGQGAKDVPALVEAMKGLARVVRDHRGIDQIDLNPVIVYDKGLAVVDCRIYTRQ